jgi:hypothetical protein
MLLRNFVLLFLVAALTACGSTSQVTQPVEPMTAVNAKFVVGKPVNAVPKESDQPPEHFLAAVAGYVKNELEKGNRLAADGEPALTLEIKVTQYRMRSGFSRALFGVFAGKDGIASEVSVHDADGKVRGSATVSTYNVMAIGAEEDVARMHGEEIAKTLFARLDKAKAEGR